jgi:hypothetical protein
MEDWRPAPEFPGYEVSSLGRVRSTDRIVRKLSRWGEEVDHLRKGKLLSLRKSKLGYLLVSLRRDGKAVGKAVHVLVATAFLGPRPDGLIVLHGKRGALCNEVSNLSYGTYRQNNLDRHRDGKPWASKLTTEQVQLLREMPYKRGMDYRLAREWGVSRTCVYQARTGARHSVNPEPATLE